MNYIKVIIFCIIGLISNLSYAQTKNSFIIKLDSLEIDIYNNVDYNFPIQIGVAIPPLKIDLNNLPEPTIFIINGKITKYKKFSEFSTTIDKIDTIEIIRNPDDLQNLGFNKYKSAVIITTKKE
jgi:hypothetical protein